ncbi:MAG: Ribosomal-protein-S18p-alanine acetyltransferase [uncultured Thermomicrobiales bacterium]|uniref:Ribosomal-protein-S18p-alanine acetyltransferase n=1 Tax=uncultured Thermomicrobiales bacterium TaxID=1645740 RepID=A0A6J4UW85_9BACT|nr:MAG: Ribosomal-protein-S18p-alanine acetyltransferase [uncultured Thermomicrobiales bacterium]
MAYYIEPMQQDDVPEVSQVERRCFTNPWPSSAYRRELRNPEHNYYIVARWRDDGAPPPQPVEERPRAPLTLLPFVRRAEPAPSRNPILGFGGMWIMLDEAHITTIGVVPEHRGRSLGELLFVTLLDEAARRKARWVTLEVRVSNASAQSLYRKYGFTQQGLRKRYYSDNGEDAHIMWSPSLHESETGERYRELRAELERKLPR